MKWTKRTAFSYQFKGRARRGLFWRKAIYEQWFNYAKISTESIPTEFGDLNEFSTFEEWWRHPDYGFELFCEPAETEPLEIVTEIPECSGKNVHYLKIDRTGDPAKLKLMFKQYMEKNLLEHSSESKARFQPSKQPAEIKIITLKKYYDCYIIREVDGNSRKDVLKQRYGKTYVATEEVLRTVSRETQRVKQIFENMKSGTFP